jgi:hypothetical protein
MANPEKDKENPQNPAPDMDDILKQKIADAIAKERAEWEKEAAEKQAESDKKAKASEKATEKSAAKAPPPEIDPMEERVPLMLPLLSGYEEPRFVAVNGETVLIPRGKTVMVKRKFIEAMSDSDRQDGMTLVMLNSMAEKDQSLGDLTKK